MFTVKSRESAKTKAEGSPGGTKPKVETEDRAQANPLWHQLATRVQAKLAVGAPDDLYEREANRVADQVMRMPDGSSNALALSFTSAAASTAQHNCSVCEEEDKLQRKQSELAPDGSAAAPPVVLEALKAPGQRLDAATRSFFEPRLGADLGAVRVHTDVQAGAAARAIHARAFAFGRNVVFGQGQYRPRSDGGRRLLAHELTHVVQQSGADAIRVGQSDDNRGLSANPPNPHALIQRDDGGNTCSGESGVCSLDEIAAPDPARVSRLQDLLTQITEQTAASLRIRGELDDAAATVLPLEEELNQTRETLLGALEERVSLLDLEIDSLQARTSANPTSSPNQPEFEQMAWELMRYENERRQHQSQLRPLRRWKLRQQIASIEQEIEEINYELLNVSPVSDPTDPTAELLFFRQQELERRKRELAASLTSGATEFEQWDSRWGATRYGQSAECTNIKAAGCGPTSLAIVLNYLYQEDPEGLASSGAIEIVTPQETAAYAATHGRVCNSGTAGDTMVTQVDTQWPGFRGQKITLSEATDHLRRGELVIFLCHSCTGQNRSGGDKGYGGHFMVLNGVNGDGTVYNVLDPGANEARGILTISLSELQNHASGFWIIERK